MMEHLELQYEEYEEVIRIFNSYMFKNDGAGNLTKEIYYNAEGGINWWWENECEYEYITITPCNEVTISN